MENLSQVIARFEGSSVSRQFISFLDKKGPASVCLDGTGQSATTLFAATVIQQKKGLHVFILPEKEEAGYFFNDLRHIMQKDVVFFLPDSFKRPGQFKDVDKDNVLLRMEAVRKLNGYQEGQTLCVVTYPEAFFEKTINTGTFSASKIDIRKGGTVDTEQLLEKLNSIGFEIVDFVYEPGQFSIRGGIVDIFSYANDYPYRFELFGDEVESIRTFDPTNQLSVMSLQSFSIIPDLQEQTKSGDKVALPDIFHPDSTLWLKDWGRTKDTIQTAFDNFHKYVKGLKEKEIEEKHHFLKEPVFHNFEHLTALEEKIEQFRIAEIGQKPEYAVDERIQFDIVPQPDFNKNFDLLIKDLKQKEADGYTVYFFCENKRQIERIYNIFEDLKAEVVFHPVPIAIHLGFVDNQTKTCCYTDHQIFQRYHKYAVKKGFDNKKALLLKTLKELQPGDYVTHIDHGVGRFSGLQKIEVNGQMQEAVRLIYSDNDLLYVNINSLHKIAKFTGKDGTAPRVNKLGSDAWERVKRKTKKKIQDIAEDLIKLYAKRRASEGFAFSPDTYLQTELEASFIYEDTPDQEKATADIKHDMEAPHPMDRLICGDVGFGKTEVAIRAAFKAVTDSKQVAVLVPTTILAMQHYKTFKERLKDFPCTVDYVNRFRKGKVKKEVLQKTAEGKVDILIGTHAILGKTVKFQNLGLLIIDEEQKFGVKSKERLREFKSNVDTLTLTATPIPRTLQFSLMGARDLSTIQTPPPNRQPIETELHTFNQDVIREAIYYEVYRGGQVYFVHNRVKDIQDVSVMLRKLCPDVDFAVAHGQMEGDKLEEVMFDFIEHKYDVLICTNIVESGLDITNANTIIINNAHWFGLSDLHQLRGRVGRSNKKAFCYLFAPPIFGLPNDSRKRLQTIEQFSELGSGISIAMRDLDIRGAGNLLGGEQSGFISEIGFEMYQKILDEAITELKETEFRDLYKEEIEQKTIFSRDCQIDTDLEILIPDTYIPNVNERLSIYTQIDYLKDKDAMQKLMHELDDRFGKLPPQVVELFKTVELRWLAQKLGFEKISIKNQLLKAYFIENQDSVFYESQTFGAILQWVQKHASRCKLKQTPKHLMLITSPIRNINETLQLLTDLEQEVGAERQV